MSTWMFGYNAIVYKNKKIKELLNELFIIIAPY